MEQEKVLKKNKNFYCGVIFTVLEGLLSGSNFMVLYAVMQMLYRNEIRKAHCSRSLVFWLGFIS